MTEEKLVKAVQQARRKRDATAKDLTEARATRMRLKVRRSQGAKISVARIAAYTVKVGLLDGRLDGLERRVKRAEQALAKYRATQRPPLTRLGLTVEEMFGSLGPLTRWTGHYTAGPRDDNDADALRLWRQYHEQHRLQGWGGIGYHVGITTAGTIVLLRPAKWKGAHVGGQNTGNIGVVMHGNTGDRMSAAQERSLQWLLANPEAAGLPAALKKARGYVHKDFNATSCPGDFEAGYRRAAR